MKKTILYLRTDLGTQDLQAGGSVAHTLGVIKGFQSQGYNIRAASSAMIGIMQDLLLMIFIPLRMSRWASLCGFKISCILSNFIFFYKVRSLCTPHDTLCIYQRYSLLNMVGVLLSWRYKIPLVLEFNGSEVWVDEHWSKKRWLRLRWLIKLIERINLGYARTIVVVSDALKDELIAHGVSAHKIVMHPNGVDTEYFDSTILSSERVNIRKSLAIHDRIVFGFIGTFSYWHGIEILAYMIPEVIKKYSQAHFLLIGDGPLRVFLQYAVQDVSGNVHFLGTIPQAQARNYLAACDAFVLPTQPNPDGTRFFGSPTKLFEYMSMAKPIIASDIEQVAQILSPALYSPKLPQDAGVMNQQLGILVDPEDKDGFVEAAEFVITTSHDWREAIGYNARKKVCSYYTWQHHVQALIHCLSAQ